MSTTFYAIGTMPLTDEGRDQLIDMRRVWRRDQEIFTARLATLRRECRPADDIMRCERALADITATLANIERSLDTGFC